MPQKMMNRPMIRDDLSNKLIHLTKGTFLEAEIVFRKILEEKKLRGSSKDIKGGHNVICFSEAPLSKLGLILANHNMCNMRYMPFGLMFEKKYLFDKGARPAIYQPSDEYEYLHKNQQFRHVRFEPNNKIDWTWEREWRIQIDELPLDHENVTLIIPDRKWEKEFQKKHHNDIIRSSIALREFGPIVAGEFKWHFISLNDLGYEMLMK